MEPMDKLKKQTDKLSFSVRTIGVICSGTIGESILTSRYLLFWSQPSQQPIFCKPAINHAKLSCVQQLEFNKITHKCQYEHGACQSGASRCA
jgi:hypothetical protein